MSFNKKNLVLLVVVLGVFVVAEGTGLTAAPKEFVGMLTAKVKGFLSGLFNKHQ